MQNEDIIQIAEEKQRNMRKQSILRKQASQSDEEIGIEDGALRIKTIKL